MLRVRTCVAAMVAALLMVAPWSAKAESTQEKLEKMQKELEDIRRELNAPPPAVRSNVEKALDNKYGPNATAVTRTGKLNISVLTQVWYYQLQHDRNGLFNDPTLNAIDDTNQGQDNSSFRVRRTEIKFTMDLNENITSVVMIDPAREATSFPLVTDNQAQDPFIFKRVNQVAPEFATSGNGGTTSNITNVQVGGGAVPRLLQDAYIWYHGVIPHHDFQTGQFKPFFGEEGIRSSGQLDFVERSFVGIIQDNRDMGFSAHGTWWNDRFQYWGGMYDSPANYHLSGGQFANRSDDNDFKDLCFRALVRPLWKDDCWGSVELGGSAEFGKHGESGGSDPSNNPVNGLNRKKTWAQKYDGWAYIAPGGVVKGWWLRGEYLWMNDRNAPGAVIDLQGNGNGGPLDEVANVTGVNLRQVNPTPFSSHGFYLATGYKLGDSNFCDCAPAWFKPLEFAFRYDTYQNVEVADAIRNNDTKVFATQVWTAGINYYIRGHDAKIQANYNWVDNPSGTNTDNAVRKFHKVKNDSFVVSFQVMF